MRTTDLERLAMLDTLALAEDDGYEHFQFSSFDWLKKLLEDFRDLESSLDSAYERLGGVDGPI